MFKQFLKRKTDQKGFTLMELMVVIVIVAILAAVAVPLYVNYVKDAKRTEAKGVIGAIITAEQAFYQKSAGNGAATYAVRTDLETGGLLDIADAEAQSGWVFTVDLNGPDGYTVTATNTADATLSVTYAHTRGAPAVWTP